MFLKPLMKFYHLFCPFTGGGDSMGHLCASPIFIPGKNPIISCNVFLYLIYFFPCSDYAHLSCYFSLVTSGARGFSFIWTWAIRRKYPDWPDIALRQEDEHFPVSGPAFELTILKAKIGIVIYLIHHRQ